jgi:asparaginyl-tRNA synthetase
MLWRSPWLRSARVGFPHILRDLATFRTKTSKAAPLVTHAQLLGRLPSGSGLSRGEPADHTGNEVKVAGLVRSARWKKSMVFAHIQDGTTYEPLQAILPVHLATGAITNGAYVELVGKWETSPAKGQSHELQVTAVENVGPSDAQENPIQKAAMTPQYLRTIPHLRIRTPCQALVARARSQITSSVSQHFYSRSRPVIQVHPPLITSSDCEGAGEVFTISAPKKSKDDTSTFFKEPKYLTVSSQLHLEAWSADVGDVWALSPTFRAEESDTSRHLAEFYMLEAEFRSVVNLEEVMSEAESLIRAIATSLSASDVGKELLQFYNDRKHRPPDSEQMDLTQRWNKVAAEPWPRITYTDAIAELIKAYNADSSLFTYEPDVNNGLALEHERWIVQKLSDNNPIFISHYPQPQKPFYMLPSHNQTSNSHVPTVECFDLLLPHGYAEVCGGSLREHRLENLINALREKNLLQKSTTRESEYPYLQPGESLGTLQWYADLRRFGSSPHGGFGIGFDRLLAYLTGVGNVRDVVGFPRYWGVCQC